MFKQREDFIVMLSQVMNKNETVEKIKEFYFGGARKLKYFQYTNYKYLTCTFNNTHTHMCCTTRENIERCNLLYGVTEMWMPAIKSHDRVVRGPLDENVFWFGV